MLRPRLAEFMRQIRPDSVAILPSSLETTRSHDTHYRHRQDSDFFYLTGFDEPDSIAVIAPAHPEHQYMLFVRPPGATWTKSSCDKSRGYARSRAKAFTRRRRSSTRPRSFTKCGSSKVRAS